MPPLALAVVLFGLVIQGFALVPVAHRLGLVIPLQDVPQAEDREAP